MRPFCSGLYEGLNAGLVLVQRDAGALRAHTLAVNDAAICFLEAARQRDGDELGALSWRHEVAHPLSRGRVSDPGSWTGHGLD